MDIVSKEIRSRMMSGIKGKNTQPEIMVCKLLHAQGFRYRLHVKSLPGKPDIVLKKYKICIFVHGCFWHRHCQCKYTTTPTTRAEFWSKKFGQTQARDKKNFQILTSEGWRVIEIWECWLKKGTFDSQSLFCTIKTPHETPSSSKVHV